MNPTSKSVVAARRVMQQAARAVVDTLETRTLFASSVTLPVLNDAYVRDGSSANLNYGQEAVLTVKKGPASFQRQSYLQFAAGASIGQGNISNAKLRVYGEVIGATTPITVGVHSVNSSNWDETSLKWANRPIASASPITTKPIADAPAFVEYDVTSFVKSQQAANASSINLALIATDATSASVNFNSSEATANAPELVVTFDDGTASAPGPVTGLTATTNGLGINLSWAVASNATSYNILRVSEELYQQGVMPSLYVSGHTGTTFTDNIGHENAKYRYIVRARNAVGVGPYSATVLGQTATGQVNGAPTVAPMSTPNLQVRVSSGQVRLPSGAVVSIPATTLTFDAPTIISDIYRGAAPTNWINNPSNFRWPDASANLHPPTDTLVLGGLYHGVLPDSVVVKDANTGKIYVRNNDYKYNEEWGQVMNLNAKLGTPSTGALEISYKVVLQRLDLVQVNADGSVTIKKGKSAVVAPTLPTADAGSTPLAGVYVYTLDGARYSGFTITARDINMIRNVAPVAPINPNTIPNTVNKLKSGQNVNIAFFGDSITAGAEAGAWWRDDSKTYRGVVRNTLESRYAGTVTETAAYEGGVSATGAGANWKKFVTDPARAGKKIDLVVIAMGMNDYGKPSLDPYKNALRNYISEARSLGIEVLLVTPMQSNPYYDSVFTNWVPRSQIAQAMRDVAAETNTACADVYTAWVQQANSGILPASQLHNWFNHPGIAGHKVYADTILRFFPQ